MKKFIIQDNQLRLGNVEFHRDLRNPTGSIPTGGGFYYIRGNENKVIFYGSSVDFGNVTEKDLITVRESGNFPLHLENFDWFFSRESMLFEILKDGNLLIEIYNPKKDKNMKLNFCGAIDALKSGKRLTREGWNGKDMFVFKQIPAEIALDIIPKMQSVPEDVKLKMLADGTTLKYTNQLAIVNKNGNVNSWLPSVEDIFAEDWIILD